MNEPLRCADRQSDRLTCGVHFQEWVNSFQVKQRLPGAVSRKIKSFCLMGAVALQRLRFWKYIDGCMGFVDTLNATEIFMAKMHVIGISPQS